MAINEAGQVVTMEVAGAIGGNLAVIQTAARTVGVAGAQADPFGVTLESVTATEFANGKREIPVMVISGGGRVALTSSAAIAVNSNIGCAASGKIRVAVTGDTIIGKAEEAATATDQLITINIDRKITPAP